MRARAGRTTSYGSRSRSAASAHRCSGHPPTELAACSQGMGTPASCLLLARARSKARVLERILLRLVKAWADEATPLTSSEGEIRVAAPVSRADAPETDSLAACEEVSCTSRQARVG